MKNPSRFYKRLCVKIKFPFSLSNYGKPLIAQNITRHHSRFYYDEYSYIKDDPKVQESLLVEEKKLCENFLNTKTKEIEKYFNVSEKRKDIRTSELPERYENYEYFTKFDRLENTNDYEVIYRKSLINTTEEKVIKNISVFFF
jgi:hypothetical protein